MWTVMVRLSSKKSKAQITSSEFLIVSVVLVILITAGVMMWNSTINRSNESMIREDMEMFAVSISDQLIKSHGMPTDWEDDTTKIYSLGLAKENYVLDEKKVDIFVNMNYNQLKSLMGIGGYEFYFRLVYTNGTDIKTKGSSPTANSQTINSKRVVMFKNEIVYMDLMVWI